MAITSGGKLRIGTHGKGMWEISVLGALPVNYLSFKAYEKPEGKVTLDWKTASESNNKGFEIRRSIYVVIIMQLCILKGLVSSRNGTSSDQHSYTYIDALPAVRSFFTDSNKLIMTVVSDTVKPGWLFLGSKTQLYNPPTRIG